MVQMVKELTRLKGQSGSDVDGTEMVAKLLARAKQLQQIPAAQRPLRSPEICTLYVVHCDKLMLKKQPYKDQDRDYKTVTSIACRALVSAIEMYLNPNVPQHTSAAERGKTPVLD
jgi:hypothetical protein